MNVNLIISDIYNQENDDTIESVDNTINRFKNEITKLNEIKKKLEIEHNFTVIYKTFLELKKEFPNNKIKFSINSNCILFNLDQNTHNTKFNLKIEMPSYCDINYMQYHVTPVPTNYSNFKELNYLDINPITFNNLNDLIRSINKCVSHGSIGRKNLCTGDDCEVCKKKMGNTLYSLIKSIYDVTHDRKYSMQSLL